MKRLLSLFLTALIVISAVPVGAETYEGERCYMNAGEVPRYRSAGPESDILGKYVDIDVFEAYVTEQLRNYAAEIDVTRFDIPYNDEVSSALSKYFVLQVPEAFHIGSSLPFSHTSSAIVRLVPNYVYSEEEYRSVKAQCDAAVEKMLDGIKDNNSLSDAEKALLIHDRLALACEYDKERLQNDSVPLCSYNMDGVFLYGIAVCEGYAEAYDYLLSQVGIEGYICSSNFLRHAWNIIEIDGELYHVDVTWDDPVWDVYGRVMHKNFLRSSLGIYSTGHIALDYDMTPTDTAYDDFFWKDYDSAFQLVDGEIYYIDTDRAELKRYSDGEVLASVDDMWMVGELLYFNKLAKLATDGTDLIYSLSDAVYVYDISEGESRLLFAPDLGQYGNYYAIYGMTYLNGDIYFDLNNYYGRHDTNVRTKWKYTPAAALDYIKVNTLPAKTDYYIGDALDTDGLTIDLVYSDGSTKTVSSNFEVSGFSSSSAGWTEVNVTYGTKVTSFKLLVKTPAVTLERESTEFQVGDTVLMTVHTSPAEIPVTWTSSDTSVVTVTDDGFVEAVGSGTADIVATMTYNGIEYQGKCTFTSNCTHTGETEIRGAVKATADTDGYTGDTHCVDCGMLLIKGEIIPAGTTDLPTEITSDVFEVSGGIIYISAGTSVSAALEGINESAFVSILKEGEGADKDGSVSTGMTVAVMDGDSAAVSLKVVVRGDVNSDGELGSKDVSFIIRYNAGWYDGLESMPIDLDASDLNKDGEISAKDVAYLLRNLAGWDGYPL